MTASVERRSSSTRPCSTTTTPLSKRASRPASSGRRAACSASSVLEHPNKVAESFSRRRSPAWRPSSKLSRQRLLSRSPSATRSSPPRGCCAPTVDRLPQEGGRRLLLGDLRWRRPGPHRPLHRPPLQRRRQCSLRSTALHEGGTDRANTSHEAH